MTVPGDLKAAQAGSRAGLKAGVEPTARHGFACEVESGVGSGCARRPRRIITTAQVTFVAYACAYPDAATPKLAPLLERAAASGIHDGMYFVGAVACHADRGPWRDQRRERICEKSAA